MFTGLIQDTGRIAETRRTRSGLQLTVALRKAWKAAPELGESVCVNGVCLTLTAARKGRLRFDVLAETAVRSNIAAKKPGARVNLERALRPQDRLGGHFVTGHVDGLGKVSRVSRQGHDRACEIACCRDLLDGIVPKGSIAVDGISLTVARLSSRSFEVRVIPFTWQHTNLGSLKEGDTVNLETDLLGKYVRKHLRPEDSGRSFSTVTQETFKKAGFGS